MQHFNSNWCMRCYNHAVMRGWDDTANGVQSNRMLIGKSWKWLKCMKPKKWLLRGTSDS